MGFGMATMFEDFVATVGAVQGCEATKARILDLVRFQFAGAKLHIPPPGTTRRERRNEALRFTRTMRSSGASRADMRDALVARFGICRQSAHRIISKVLNVPC
jgi:hypothetical protein